jgi:hypothetical protein
MSRFRCRCGHLIIDITDDLPNKAAVLRNQDTDWFYDTVARELARFAAAVRADQRETWIAEHFLAGYPRDLSDEDVISDFLCGPADLMSGVYECERCGRLWVQRQPGADEWIAYTPEDARPHRVLASERYAREQDDLHNP